MKSTSHSHVQWLRNTNQVVKSSDGKDIEIWEFQHQDDNDALSAWATHFRNHYCLDTEIDCWRKGFKFSRTEYLNNIKLPDSKNKPGPSIRSGDFSEILVADFLEYLLDYWVPRTRYGDKTIRNESTKGCDIIGFKFFKENTISPQDTLAIFEAKAQFSGKSPKPKLQDAVDDSGKDPTRKAESLNAIKQRLYGAQQFENAEKIERFQNDVDCPYQELYGAIALFDKSVFDTTKLTSTVTSGHPYSSNLALIVINGSDMMKLVHELYRRAADEA